MKRRLGESCRDEEVAWEPSLWDHRPSQRGCLASQGFRVRFEDAGTPPFVHTPPAGVLVNVPSLSSSHRPTSSLPHPSPVGARPPHAPALSWVPQTRLTGAPAGAGGHSSVFTSPSHAGICRDRRFFLESTLCPKRATRRSPRCSGKQEKTFLSWISVLDTFNSLSGKFQLPSQLHFIHTYICMCVTSKFLSTAAVSALHSSPPEIQPRVKSFTFLYLTGALSLFNKSFNCSQIKKIRKRGLLSALFIQKSRSRGEPSPR